MRNRRTFLLVIATFCVVLLVTAFLLSRSTAELQNRLAETTRLTFKLDRELREARRELAARTAKAEPEVQPPAIATTPETKPAFPPRTKPPGLMDFTRNDPNLWNIFISSKKAELGERYGALLLRLGLSPVQQARFKEIHGEWLARDADIAAAADAQGLDREDSSIKALYEQSKNRRLADLADVLGEQGFRELQEYERTMWVRGFADGLAARVASTAPLTGAQADELARALAEASESYRSGRNAEAKDIDWTIADEKARRILTAEQFRVWSTGTIHNVYSGNRFSLVMDKIYEESLKKSAP